MKKLMQLLTMLLVVCFASSGWAALEPPLLSSSTDGLDITLDWTSVSDATGYELYYVPVASYTGPESVSSKDVGANTTFNYTLWDGASFYLAVKAYNDQETSPYSNIEVLNIEVVQVPPTAPELSATTIGLDLSLSWETVPDATGYVLSYAPTSSYSGPASFITKDVSGDTSFQAVLWDGAAFTVAVQAYNEQGSSGYSNIELFTMAYFDDDNDGFTESQGDCNDNDQSINPHAEEICGDGIDQDCVSGDSDCAAGQHESAPPQETILVSNLVSGTVVFRDSNNTNIAIPSDAFVGIFPSSFWPSPDGPLTEHSDRLRCRISDNGSFGDECYLHEESITGFASALSDPSEIFQIIVFKNHVNSGVIGWDCDEDEYKHIEETQDNWLNLVVKPEDYISAGGTCTEQPPEYNSERFTDNGDGTVSDHLLGLIWQQRDDNIFRHWDASIDYCENLSLGSSSSWRLPNSDELGSLLNESYSPLIDPVFIDTKLARYWSSTVSADESVGVIVITFYDLLDDSGNDNLNSYTRCVR